MKFIFNKQKSTLRLEEPSNNYTEFELSLVVYPLNTNINADDFLILPFDEYTDEAEDEQRSAYLPKVDNVSKVFGLIISIVILIFFLIFLPQDLFSVQSVISILGAYTLGKDFWKDIENVLVKLTQNRRLSYKENQYYYFLKRNSTLDEFLEYSRELRYKANFFFPQKMDLIKESNSKTFKGFYKNFEKGAILFIKNLKNEDFNYSFSMKFSGIRKVLFIEFIDEYFQLLNDSASGAVVNDELLNDKVLVKRIVRIGNLKWYVREEVVGGSVMRFAPLT